MVALRQPRLAPLASPQPRRVRHAARTASDVEPLPLVRSDTLPEHADYRDTGCELSPTCLRCPLRRCKYDDPGSTARMAREARDREIVLLRRKYRAPVALLAATYGVSRRTVFRVLQDAGYGRRRRDA
jgi:hypothetical protein